VLSRLVVGNLHNAVLPRAVFEVSHFHLAVSLRAEVVSTATHWLQNAITIMVLHHVLTHAEG